MEQQLFIKVKNVDGREYLINSSHIIRIHKVNGVENQYMINMIEDKNIIVDPKICKAVADKLFIIDATK